MTNTLQILKTTFIFQKKIIWLSKEIIKKTKIYPSSQSSEHWYDFYRLQSWEPTSI